MDSGIGSADITLIITFKAFTGSFKALGSFLNLLSLPLILDKLLFKFCCLFFNLSNLPRVGHPADLKLSEISVVCAITLAASLPCSLPTILAIPADIPLSCKFTYAITQ